MKVAQGAGAARGGLGGAATSNAGTGQEGTGTLWHPWILCPLSCPGIPGTPRAWFLQGWRMLSASWGWVGAEPEAEPSCPCRAQISAKEGEMSLFKWHLEPLATTPGEAGCAWSG